ncbi:hypothetical protein V0R37_15170 [Pollutimonas sp. H1-120]|uniref:hypothetical protein n=1 Tax=Pollutimonas sp. H1-120 TaxID=3148824 RepID=UPI003B52747A
MSNYNPYVNLAALAAINVLKDEDPHSEIYVVLEVCVHIGASQAGMWLIAGKPGTRNQLIDLVMAGVMPMITSPSLPQELVSKALPLDRVRLLIEKGFDWLVKFEIDDITPTLVDGRLTVEAI